MKTAAECKREAEEWLKSDPDAATREELAGMLERGDSLEDHFAGPLKFGTAGLRGLLGPGPNRMNRVVVMRAMAGFCRHLKETVPGACERGVCVGFDGRRMSREFAADAIAVARGEGFVVHAFDAPTPTPTIAYSIRHLKAAGGVVVTASHNPPAYNGFKVFWENGAQIVPPHDAKIAAQIANIKGLEGIELGDASSALTLDRDVIDPYLAEIATLPRHPNADAELVIAHTALHGVGTRFVREALGMTGFSSFHTVASQAEPDARFPTVDFPNPEEDGAMDAVVALAKEVGADVALANDPDADRLAVSVLHDGEYVPLGGNEIGILLAHYLLSTEGDSDGGAKPLVLNTIVSSPMLLSVAEAHGAIGEQTLTGHKWIHNRALELEATGEARFVFGYEEALGYAPMASVRDKDGVSSLVLMADLARHCKAEGRTLIDELERCFRRYGMYLSDQISLVLPGAEGAAQIAGAMEKIRQDPPVELGGYRVVGTQDFLAQVRRAGDEETPLTLPKANAMVLEVEGGHRAMLRPSGTEPKLKHYFDVRIEVAEGEPMSDARERGEALLKALSDALLSLTRP